MFCFTFFFSLIICFTFFCFIPYFRFVHGINLLLFFNEVTNWAHFEGGRPHFKKNVSPSPSPITPPSFHVFPLSRSTRHANYPNHHVPKASNPITSRGILVIFDKHSPSIIWVEIWKRGLRHIKKKLTF